MPHDEVEALRVLNSAGFFNTTGYWVHNGSYGPAGEIRAGFGAIYGNDAWEKHIRVLTCPEEATSTSLVTKKFMIEWNRFFGKNSENEDYFQRDDIAWTNMQRIFAWDHSADLWGAGRRVGRDPDYLYNFFHPSQDIFQGDNHPGINEPSLNTLLEQLKYTVYPNGTLITDIAELQRICREAQVKLFYYAPYLCNRAAITPNLFKDCIGYVESLGYTADNDWTYNWLYKPDDTKIKFCNPGPIGTLNPGVASSVCEWNILNRIYEGFMAVNPWTKDDVRWAASGYTMVEWVNASENARGFKVTFIIRPGITWHDGDPFTADDAMWSWNFLKNIKFARYSDFWQYYVRSEKINDLTVRCYFNNTGFWYLYDIASAVMMWRQSVWQPFWGNKAAAEAFRPWEVNYDTHTGSSGHGQLTCLVGTGPWVFVEYDNIAMVARLMANRPFTITGWTYTGRYWAYNFQRKDTNLDFIVDWKDIIACIEALGAIPGDPRWQDGMCDLNGDHVVDGKDLRVYGIELHDVAVTNVKPSATVVGQGCQVDINVTVRNQGISTETFNVTVYANTTVIGTPISVTLTGGASATITFTWDTTSSLGNYTIKAEANVVPEEYDTGDNTLIDGTILIEPVYHDVAVTDVRIPFDFAYVGENVTINVDAWNAGNVQETLNVTVYADMNPTTIGDEITVGNQTLSLPSKGSTTLTFDWNTTDVAPGNYTISGNVTCASQDADTSNNMYVDGKVEIALSVPCQDIDITSPAIVQLNPSIFNFNHTIGVLVASIGNMTIKSTGFEGDLRVAGVVNNTVHLFIGQPGTNRQIYYLPLDGSIEVPLWLGLEPGTYTGTYEVTLKVCGTYKSKITLNIIHIWVCQNGAYTVQGGTATFSWTLTGGSWAYLKAEPKLPHGWSFQVDPPVDTPFETPRLISLNITAAPDAGEEEIGIVTLSAFKNDTNTMFWQFTYFATVGNKPPIIEEVKPPIHTFDGKLLFSTVVKDLGAGIENVRLFLLINEEFCDVPMNWQQGDTFNSTLYTAKIPQVPNNSQIYYVIGATDWLGEQTFSDEYAAFVNYDISAKNVTPCKTVAGQGLSCNISAAFMNEGTVTEELLNVAFYANTTLIHVQTVPLLANGASTTVTFTWNTTGFTKGNYTITAYAVPVHGETGTTDNTCTGGVVLVTIPGDVDGSRKVDWRDIYTGMIIRFMAKIGDPGYVPNSDVTCDGTIDWKDIYQAIIHFNESW